MIARIQVRRDTSSNWSQNDPYLTLGEIGYETDTHKFKVGTINNNEQRLYKWSELPYQMGQWLSDSNGNISYGTQPNEGDVSIQNDLVVHGDFVVNGNTTSINTTQLDIQDNIIVLNSNLTTAPPPTLDSGIEVERGTEPNRKLYWDEQTLSWIIEGDLNVEGDLFSNGNSLWALNNNDIYFEGGSVGIGLDTPSTALHVKDIEPILTLEDRDDSSIWRVGQGSDLFFINADGVTDGSMFSIKSDGNVGVGLDNPLEKLEVSGAIKLGTTTSSNEGSIKYDSNDFLGYNGTEWVSFISQVWTKNGNDIYYNTGKVGIGIDTPLTPLHIKDDSVDANTCLRLENDNQVWDLCNMGGEQDKFKLFDVSFNLSPLIVEKSSPNNSIYIKSDGTVGIGTDTPTESLDVIGNITASGRVSSTSDIRIKENIELISNPIDKVKTLSGYTFNKKGENLRLVGMIAQEVEKVLPEAVSENQNGIKSLAYGNLVALLVECVKKQDERIESLEKKLEELS